MIQNEKTPVDSLTHAVEFITTAVRAVAAGRETKAVLEPIWWATAELAAFARTLEPHPAEPVKRAWLAYLDALAAQERADGPEGEQVALAKPVGTIPGTLLVH